MDGAKSKLQLNIRRTSLLASLSRAEQFLRGYEADRDALQVAIRLENLEVLWQGLEDTQTALEEMETDNESMVRNLQYRSDFEPKLFAIKAGLLGKLPPAINSVSDLPVNPPLQLHSGLSGLKLPTISLPEFAGDYQDWLGFHDTFFALIHSNPEVAAIQKFHYLRAAVKGEASQVIESITISAANYPLAWDALVARYSNEYLLKKRHLQALLEIPRMKEESAAALHELVDDFERHTKVLKQLGEPTDSWSTILEHLLCTRLHHETLNMWEDHASTLEEPSYSKLVEFLQRRMRVLESISVNHDIIPPVITPYVSGSASGSGASGNNQRYKRPGELRLSAHAITEVPNAHSIERPAVSMGQLKKLTLHERMNLVNTKRLCFNCLFSDHFVSNCPCQTSCHICRKRHHTLLHPGYVDNLPIYQNRGHDNAGEHPQYSTQTNVATSIIKPLTPRSIAPMEGQTSSVAPHARNNNVFMLTVVLVVVDAYGQKHLARALLDCASQPNLISDRMAQILRLKRRKVNVQLQGPGSIAVRSSDSVFTKIYSRKEDFSRDVEFLVLPRVTADMPESDVATDCWNVPKELFLADPNFNKRAEIDMIIGLSHFFACFKSAARVHLADDLPELVDSVFGWIVVGSGEVIPNSPDQVHCHVSAICLVTLEESLERFWKLEELPSRSDYSVEERYCETFYASTVMRDDTGRYTVRLPRHPEFDARVGDSKAAALRRFKLLEERLERNPALKDEYHKFMREYVALGHMRQSSKEDQQRFKGYYLPHHPVVKEESTTTKVRVVFDASAKTSTGFSLNDSLCVGPVVQDDLLSIVLRFRKYLVALVADIEKMYRQVSVQPEDVPYQRILWRFDKTEPIQIYDLLTVTYGLAPSSFLATRTLQQLADDEGAAYPTAEQVLRKGFYVDDCLGGEQSVEKAVQLRDELIELLQKGGFSLRKFSSNKLEALQGLSAEQIGTQSSLTFTSQETVKALGVIWEPEQDMLRFDSNVKQSETIVTKRSILWSISQLFDPLGLIAPVVIRGKLIMQELWMVQCNWDEPVPKRMEEKWAAYCRDLPKITEFRTERYAFLPNASIQLHTFCDASEVAFGACVYARSVDPQGNVRVQLLASKSRVAPLKRVTLPRLELCAAVIGAQLHAHIVQALQLEISESRFWSDSTVTLQWLQSPPNTWKTFVANRVSDIQASTHGSQWSHISGKENPADLVSRGMQIDDFLSSELWKYGSRWLRQPQCEWPAPTVLPALSDNVEIRKVFVAVVQTKPSVNPMFTRYSSLDRLVRVTAYCLRFVCNVRSKARTQPLVSTGLLPSKTLSVTQLTEAHSQLVRLAQADAFQEELRALKTENSVSKRSSIRLLNPFIDQKGTLRVGGRLRLSDKSFPAKHPALLPSFHPFTRLLLTSYHLKLLHGGGQLTLALVREEYWPINGRRMIRSVIRACFRCVRADPVPVQQRFGQLPVPRVTASRPFTVTGVDYAGPVYLRAPHKRASSPKSYISVFICFSTKAVHLELVSDLTTAAFLAAFRRFTSRRGLPAHVHSDNGTNFQGAKNELRELYQLLEDEKETNIIQSKLARDGITWHMNPPKAPHFGGLWEAAVKVAKKHLHRQLGNSRLCFEDMCTVLSQIEASMNSRPLVPLTEDPNDLNALTPAHFLIGATMYAIPDPDVRSIPINRLDHYQRMQLLHQQFWHRWRTEYLQELQRETSVHSENTSIRPGQLAVVLDDFQAPLKWPLARIVNLHPGQDGLVRVVTLRTAKGIIQRPVVKICLLPTQCEETSNAGGATRKDITQPILATDVPDHDTVKENMNNN
ncbi:uncharacterized protein LOC131680822 [Topomyia yanbarensis]|uniref:uncharacterized protein LOC131680822 n=1 Tax=Topomyia yanbarensis TaxID=2498891 RepID=UPI00273CF184|nr:uncharacterized protein LOC131680822 [Topomyia yanbarensis]